MRVIAQSVLMPWMLAVAVGAAADPEGPIRWRTDFAMAQREAQVANKLLVVNVHATWCAPCRKLQQTTLRDASLAALMQEKCVAVSVDGDRHPELLQKWSVAGYPTQVFLRPDGRVAGKLEGFVDAVEYRRYLSLKLLEMDPDSHRTAGAAQAAGSLPADSRALPAAKTAVRARAPGRFVQDCDAAAPLALRGYCPVSMIRRRELLPGSPEHCLTFGGRRYHFRSAAERQLFTKQPDAYLPAENGHCVVTYLEKNRLTPGQLDYPALFGERVYLFAGEPERRRFLLDPEKYVDERGAVRRTANSRPDVPVR